ncbi:MAG: hypothetical protein WC178_00285 [Candidatus Paceibacterota bacterium]
MKKEIVLISVILLVFVLLGVICAVVTEKKYGVAQQSDSFSSSPEIINVFLNKNKFIVGDQMLITVEVKDLSGVKAYVENENGESETIMSLITGDEKHGTWQGTWEVQDTLDEKKYQTRIVATSAAGDEFESSIEWTDPNPGHNLSQVVVDQNLNMGGYGITLGGETKTSWSSEGVITSPAIWVNPIASNMNRTGCYAIGSRTTYLSYTVSSPGGRLKAVQFSGETCAANIEVTVNGATVYSNSVTSDSAFHTFFDKLDRNLNSGDVVNLNQVCTSNYASCNKDFALGALGLWQY